LPIEFAIGPAVHRWRISKIARRDGKLGSLFTSAIASLSVAAPAVLSVNPLSSGDGGIGGRNRIF
jgi:hypothetical protein